jgi:Zn2+/Cd2+-exporting ATPase
MDLAARAPFSRAWRTGVSATVASAAAAHSGPAPHAHHHGQTETRLLVASTAVCLIAGLVGWTLDLLRAPPADSLRLMAIVAYGTAYIAGGWHTLQHAWGDLREGRVNVDLLMLTAAAGSAALGEWPEGATLLFLFSLSNTLETVILGRMRRAVSDLMHLTPEDTVVLRDGVEHRVPVETLATGDTVLVHPGERFPADGIVRVGQTSVDQSPMTGESIPVDKEPGDAVFSGTLNQQGVIQVEVTRTGGESTLARMVQLVEQAQAQRAESQRFTEWFGERYTWFVLLLATATLLGSRWLVSEEWLDSAFRAMTVLVVASPCAVVISIPASILAAISSAARGGVLFKGGAALERAATLRAMAFDKTGTLTIGRPRVVNVMPSGGVDEAELLRVAAAVEAHSEHPLATAIVREAEARGVTWSNGEEITAVTAQGIEGRLKGELYRVGKFAWLDKPNLPADSALMAAIQEAATRGQTVIGVANEHRWLGAIGIADTLRSTAGECIAELRRLGLAEMVMLTGDAEPVAKDLAGRLGIGYGAALMPDEKLARIKSLRETVGPTGMIGDGMNDAPSLAAATVGFSLGGAGTDVALETADVVILADDLRRLPYAIALSRKTQQIIRQNLAFAFAVMLGLLITTYVWTLPLPLAVLGHEGSTVLVILNGLRLFAFPKPGALPPM